MALILHCAVSLRIVGDALDPEDVSRRLGVEPTFAKRKGDQRMTRTQRIVVAPVGIWGFGYDQRQPGDLSEKIAMLLGRFDAVDLAEWDRLGSLYRLDVFCGLFMADWNEGIVIDRHLLKALAERGWMLGLDIYAPEEKEREPEDLATDLLAVPR